MKFFMSVLWSHKKIPVNGNRLLEKVLEFATKVKVKNFITRKEWMECFRKCHNTSFKTISGERCV